MGRETLSTLTKQSDTSYGHLKQLLDKLAQAAMPIRDKLHGENRVALDNFINHTDEIAAEMHTALGRHVEGTAGQNRAFTQADAEQASATRAAEGRADYSSANFSRG